MRIVIAAVAALLLAACSTTTERMTVLADGNRLCSEEFCVEFPGKPTKTNLAQFVDTATISESQRYDFETEDGLVRLTANFGATGGRGGLHSASDEELREAELRHARKHGLNDAVTYVMHGERAKIAVTRGTLPVDHAGERIHLVLENHRYIGKNSQLAAQVMAPAPLIHQRDAYSFLRTVEER